VNKILILSLLALLLISSCKTKTQIIENKDMINLMPPIIIYKTKKDYYNNVPVLLSDDKTKIVSFPDIKDLKRGNELCLPTLLNNGYLLDNRGINKNVAFLSITYKEYVDLPKTPSVDELYEKIIDRKPLKRMYYCGKGPANENDIAEINKNILQKNLKGYNRKI
jgi:hypothetical protein